MRAVAIVMSLTAAKSRMSPRLKHRTITSRANLQNPRAISKKDNFEAIGRKITEFWEGRNTPLSNLNLERKRLELQKNPHEHKYGNNPMSGRNKKPPMSPSVPGKTPP